ncbi:TldD/PmbA family protein, partial [Candidatus Bipolaricaulota bacterium]
MKSAMSGRSLWIFALTSYDEFYSQRVFVNSEGSIVEYDLLSVGIAGFVVTKRGNIVQRVRFAFGGNEDFARLRGREDDLRQHVIKAQELLDAEPAKAGIFPVILDQSEASVFIHEAFGHLSEADGLQNNPAFRERLQLGTSVAKPLLTVTDDPTVPGHPGSYEIDDEGVRGVRTPLITEGVLTGRLHSRETAAEFGEPLSGNMRAVDVQFTPIVRMSNISIEPGASSFDEMVAAIDDGYYLVGAKGGQTSGDQFTFGAQWGYRIENGKLGPMVRDINMSGELFSTLEAISMIGNDRRFGERGGCGKGGGGPMQLNRKSGSGAPHIKIDHVTVGGVG